MPTNFERFLFARNFFLQVVRVLLDALQSLDYPTAAALSFMLMAAILILVAVYVRRSGTDELV